MFRAVRVLAVLGLLAAPAAVAVTGTAAATSASVNSRVTQDDGSTYVSADQLAGGTYTDGVLTRCGVDRRMQNEPTLAIDPRNPSIWTAGSNDYCTVPTVGDAWTGYYRSIDGGTNWTDSLVPGYAGDNSPQAQGSPLAQLAQQGAIAAGDPEQAWDGDGRLFYMGNNFSRGTPNGGSFRTRGNIGSIWVTTYGPTDANDPSTDGAHFVRTVLLKTNTSGQGQFNDKTGLAVDPNTGNVYAAWSVFHGSGCNEIDFARSTDHGATFSAPMKISSGICGNQGPYMAIGPSGQLYVAWAGTTGGAFGQNGVNGAALTVSTNGGQSFTKARLVATYVPFVSGDFSGNGARDCGDGPFACPTGFTFPRFDLAGPTISTDNTNGSLVLAFQVKQPSGQGLIESIRSTTDGASWSQPAVVAPSDTGHQFFPWATGSGNRISLIWYDSRADTTYAPSRPPCNDASGMTSACLNVMYASSTDGGMTWSAPTTLTDAQTNPNLEQFGGRQIPFFGDYITVAAVGDAIGAVWTDQRNAVVADDPSGDNDGADVAGDPETGGSCTSSLDACFDGTGGLDQNIYSTVVTP
jgi:hypothetical protein